MSLQLPDAGEPAPKRPIGDSRQLELLEVLRVRHKRLGQTYEGVLRAYSDGENPDCLAQAAHSMRELFDALPIAAQVERKRTAEMGDEVARISNAWFLARGKTAALTARGWEGAIDAPLKNVLHQLGEFFGWYRDENPGHAIERDVALDRFDPGRGRLPEQLRKQRSRTLNDLARYMNSVAHHNIESSRAEFGTKLAEAESFLRSFIKPTPLADRKTMDEILKGEG